MKNTSYEERKKCCLKELLGQTPSCFCQLIPFFGNFLVPFLESYRNFQFLFWIASGLYFCNVMLYQYPLLAIVIGVICSLIFVLYMVITVMLGKNVIKLLKDKKDSQENK